MSDQIVLILVIIGGAIGLLLVGVALFMMRQEAPAASDPATSAAPPDTAGEADVPATPPADEQPAAPLETPPAPAPTPPPATSWLTSLTAHPTPTANPAPLPPLIGAEELVRLWRSAQGELIVEVNGKRHRTRQELIDAGVEKRVTQAIGDLSHLLDGPASASVNSTVPATAPSAPAPQGVLESLINPSKAERPVQKVSLEEAAKIEIKRPTMDVSTQFKYLRNQQKTPEIQVKSVAEEINDILQGLILDTPLAKRGLKVADSLHGVAFVLDGRNFESVDEVPDEESRTAIRAAIKKWDAK